MPRVHFFPRYAAAADLLALLVFVTIGLSAHGKNFSAGSYARDVLPLAGAWALAALAFGLYRRPSWRALLETWFVGIAVGVVIRSFVVSDSVGKHAAFLAVALVFTVLFVLAARALLSLLMRPGGFEPPTNGLEGRRSVH
jgi:hypothetical protein